MKKLSEKATEELAIAVFSTYQGDVASQKTSADQLRYLSWVLNVNTLAKDEFRTIWKKFGFDTSLEMDGAMGQMINPIISDELGKTLDASVVMRPVLNKIFKKMEPLLLPETTERLPKVFPEYF